MLHAKTTIRIIICLLFLAISVQSGFANNNDVFNSGVMYYNDGIYSIAADKFETYLATDNSLTYASKAAYLLGVCYAKTGNYASALGLLTPYGNRYPQSQLIQKSLYWRGYAHFKRKEFTLSNELLRSYLDSGDATYRDPAQMYTASSYVEMGNLNKALELFSTIKSQAKKESIRDYALYRWSNVSLLIGNYNDALKGFTEVVIDRSDSVYARPSYFFIGETCYFLEDYEKADTYISRFMSMYPDSDYYIDSVFRLGTVKYRTGNYSEAIEWLVQYIDSDLDASHKAEALALCGESYHEIGNYQKAVEYYKILIRNFPDEINILEVHFNIALSYSEYDAWLAVPHLKKVTSNPSSSLHAKALFKLAEIFRLKGSNDEAVANYKTFTRLYPLSELTESAYINIIQYYSNAGMYSELASWLKNAIAVMPRFDQHVVFQYHSGIVHLFHIEDLDLSLQAFSYVYKNHAGSDYYYKAAYYIGFIYMKREEYIRSVDFFDESIHADDSAIAQSAAVSKGLSYYNAGRHNEAEKALREYEKVYAEGDSSGKIYYYTALNYRKARKYSSSINYFKKALMKELTAAQRADSVFYTAHMLYNQNKFEESRTYFSKFGIEFKNDPRFAETQYRAGLCAYKIGEYTKSIIYFDKVISSKNPADITALVMYQKSLAQIKLDKYTQSARTLEKLARLDYDSRLYFQAMMILASRYNQEGLRQQSVETYKKVIASGNELYGTRAAAECGIMLFTAEQYDAGIDILLHAMELYSANGSETIISLIMEYLDNFNYETLTKVYNRIRNTGLDKKTIERFSVKYAYTIIGRSPEKSLALLTSVNENGTRENSVKAGLILAEHFLMKGAPDKAKQYIDTIISDTRSIETAQAWLLLGLYYTKKGNTEKAAETYFYCGTTFTKYADIAAEALFNSWYMYTQLDNETRAQDIRSVLQKLYPESVWTRKTHN